jgi:uncharacterized membrane-anchored protein
MCCSSKGLPSRKLAAHLLVAGFCLSSERVVTLSCRADAPPSVPKKIAWVTGPTKVDLGKVAQARILDGFRFADPEGARALLESTHTVVPDGLLGVVSPASADYFVVLQYTPLGYVKEMAAQALDEDAILKAIWERTTRQNAQRLHEGSPNIVHVEWVLKPAFDANSHMLESAVRTDGRADNQSLVNYTLQRLGRRGVLQASVVKQRKDFADFGIVREAIRAISFKSGEDYRDFKEGDKVATASLSDLITADNSPTGSFLVANAAPTSASTSGTSGFRAVWIALGVIGCVGIAGSVMIARKLRQYRANQPGQSAGAGEQPGQRPEKGRNGSRLKLDVHRKPAFKPQHNHANNGNGAKRKRMFNYHKFYTEMVLQGPAPTPGELMPGFFNGYNGYGNGYNGYYNGNGNGHTETPAPVEHMAAPSASSSPTVLSAHSELIASQMRLIEEQKRLIHEQARLIEEKSKLIAEKNRLLDRQSQMIDNNLL